MYGVECSECSECSEVYPPCRERCESRDRRLSAWRIHFVGLSRCAGDGAPFTGQSIRSRAQHGGSPGRKEFVGRVATHARRLFAAARSVQEVVFDLPAAMRMRFARLARVTLVGPESGDFSGVGKALAEAEGAVFMRNPRARAFWARSAPIPGACHRSADTCATVLSPAPPWCRRPVPAARKWA